jgi:hypothetical protein
VHTFGKTLVCVIVLYYTLKWNCVFVWHHVAGVLNLADEPSRLDAYKGIRIRQDVFESVCSRFGWVPDVDYMSMSATRLAHPTTGEYLPYVSLTLDGGAECEAVHNVFCVPLQRRGWVHPPAVMVESVCALFAQEGEEAVLVLEEPAAPVPAWYARVLACEVGRVPLPVPNSEYRRSDGRGWRDCTPDKARSLVALWVDFRRARA